MSFNNFLYIYIKVGLSLLVLINWNVLCLIKSRLLLSCTEPQNHVHISDNLFSIELNEYLKSAMNKKKKDVVKATSTYQPNRGNQFLLKEFENSEESQKNNNQPLEEIKYWQGIEPLKYDGCRRNKAYVELIVKIQSTDFCCEELISKISNWIEYEQSDRKLSEPTIYKDHLQIDYLCKENKEFIIRRVQEDISF